MRKKGLMVVTAACALMLASSMAAGAAESETEAAAAETEGVQLAVVGKDAPKTLDGLKWSDYAISIDGSVIDFPVAYADLEPVLTEMGYAPKDDLSTELEPNQYGRFYFDKGDLEISLFVMNFDVNSHPASECIIGGIGLDSFSIPADAAKVELPGGIVRGISTLDDVRNAYGPESSNYDGELYTSLTYSTDAYEIMKINVDKETGTVSDIEIQDFEIPEGFEQGEASSEVPAAVAAYQKPDALSYDPHALQIRLMDNVYSLPVPVSTLIADGFVINDSETEPTVEGGGSGWVSLMLGGQKLRALAENFEKDATTIENCWVTTIAVGKQDLDVEAEIPGGISVGMSKADLEKKLSELGITAETNVSGDFTYYAYDNEDYGKGFEISVFTGTDGVYPQDAVLTIKVSNDELPQ